MQHNFNCEMPPTQRTRRQFSASSAVKSSLSHSVPTNPTVDASLTSPLPQLLPRLHQLLHRARRRKRMAVDDVALAISTLIKLPHSVLAKQRQIVHDLLEICFGPGVVFFSHIRPPSHEKILSFSLFVRLLEKIQWHPTAPS